MATSVSGNSCTPRYCSLPAGCTFSTSTKCIYYSGTNIPFLNIYQGNNLDTIITNISNYIASITGIPVITNTYAEMIIEATGAYYKRFLVLTDENKSAERTLYDYWPTIGILWVAAVDEIIF